MSRQKKPFCIEYDVYETPNPRGGAATYHARRVSKVISGELLREHIDDYTLINPGTFELVIQTLEREIPEQLLWGRDVHIKGLGTFYLKIRTKKQHITDPKAITASMVEVEGIGFTPDKEFNQRVLAGDYYFKRCQMRHSRNVDLDTIAAKMAELCSGNNYFTQHQVAAFFGLSKYKANQLCNLLVEGDDAQFVRQREGSTYHYFLKDRG